MKTPAKKALKRPAMAAKAAATVPKFLSIAEVAEITGLSEMFWRQQVMKRKIGYAKFGRRTVIARTELDQWIDERVVKAV